MSEHTHTAGGCHCGAVRYTLEAAPTFTFLCHCQSCQHLNGGMRLAGLTLPREALQVRGELSSYTYPGGKGEITQYFCGICGTPIYALPKVYGEVAVLRAGTLDSSAQFVPQKSIFTDAACSWEMLIGR